MFIIIPMRAPPDIFLIGVNACAREQSAGLIAIHSIVEALKDEYFYCAWLLRHEAFLRFDYDPDAVFSKKTDGYGFRE